MSYNKAERLAFKFFQFEPIFTFEINIKILDVKFHKRKKNQQPISSVTVIITIITYTMHQF